MLCTLLFSGKPIRGAWAILFLLVGAPAAYADRIVYFDTVGHSEIVDSGKAYGYYNTAPGMGNDNGPSKLQSKCIITVTNSSSKDQKVTVNILPATLSTGTPAYMAGGTPSPTATAVTGGVTSNVAWPFTDYTLTPNSQIVVQVAFPAPHYLDAVTQDVHCFGSISAKDSDSTQPGFVVANGMLSTWSQGSAAYQAGGTGKMRAQVRYYYNPFSIGGGRAF